MKIAVYCGSRDGDDQKYGKAARELGTWIGANGHTLVYGAGFVGIMGAVSESVQAAGGHIIGVIPQFMIEHEWEKKDLRRITEGELPEVESAWRLQGGRAAQKGSFGSPGADRPAGASPALTQDAGPDDVLLITSTMSTRKAKMMELADVYVALPGGPGTLEEITEVISLSCVEQHGKECILFNQDGYYESLRLLYENMVGHGFTDRELLKHVHFAKNVEEVIRIIEQD